MGNYFLKVKYFFILQILVKQKE